MVDVVVQKDGNKAQADPHQPPPARGGTPAHQQTVYFLTLR